MQLHNNSPEQRAVLTDMLNEVIQRLLALNFTDTKTDQEMIRHHAYLRGKYDLLVGQLQDNYEVAEPAQE